ncbi:MAG: restriction endonuclease [Acidobacteriota bacterium]|nr:restriction endonuclease [Acidobacteriota bacterium]
MRVEAQYSIKSGLAKISVHYPYLLAEVEDAILAINASQARVKLSEHQPEVGQRLYDPVALNKAFQEEMHPKGGRYQSVDCEYPTTHYLEGYKIRSNFKGASRHLDFIKEGLGIEIQFGKPPLMVCSISAKMTIFRNLGFINCGIEIVPVKALALEMSSGVSYFEQFVWDLESRGVADIDIPVLILGIDA